MMKVFSRIILILSVICMLGVLSYGQESTAEATKNAVDHPKITTKIDEFGRLGDCDAGARVDNLFIQLNNLKSAKGYIITYSGLDLLPSQFAEPPILAQIKRSIEFRRFDKGRIVFIDGGFREKQGGEMYIVPSGGDPPEPSDTVAAPAKPTGTYVWGESLLSTDSYEIVLSDFLREDVIAKREDEERLLELEASIESARNGTEEIRVAQPTESEDSEPEEEPLTPEELRKQRFDWVSMRFGDVITKQKGSSGTFIFYADDEEYNIVKLQKFVEEGRDILAGWIKLRPSQIKVVFGGYREWPTVAYHLIPKNGKAPQARPETRPEPVIEVPESN